MIRAQMTFERIEQVAGAEIVELADGMEHETLPFDTVGQNFIVVLWHEAIIRNAYRYRGVSFAICASTSISTFQAGSSSPATTTIVAAGEAAPKTSW